MIATIETIAKVSNCISIEVSLAAAIAPPIAPIDRHITAKPEVKSSTINSSRAAITQ
jgi:hypothetical protein